jgi:hypothetical protein
MVDQFKDGIVSDHHPLSTPPLSESSRSNRLRELRVLRGKKIPLK